MVSREPQPHSETLPHRSNTPEQENAAKKTRKEKRDVRTLVNKRASENFSVLCGLMFWAPSSYILVRVIVGKRSKEEIPKRCHQRRVLGSAIAGACVPRFCFYFLIVVIPPMVFPRAVIIKNPFFVPSFPEFFHRGIVILLMMPSSFIPLI